MIKVEAVVFDMDGLMFETEKLWLDSVIKTNEVYGYDVPVSLVIECMGKRNDFIDKRFKEVLGEDFDTDKFRQLNREFMNDDVSRNGLKTKKGLIDLLDFLKESGIKMAVASSSSMEKIERRFKQANVSLDYFDSIIGGDLVTKPKPDPQIYLKSCEVLGVEPAMAIALEDSEYGIMSAVSAGMMAILIPDIKQPSDDIINMAYKKFNDLTEVIDLIKR